MQPNCLHDNPALTQSAQSNRIMFVHLAPSQNSLAGMVSVALDFLLESASGSRGETSVGPFEPAKYFVKPRINVVLMCG